MTFLFFFTISFSLFAGKEKQFEIKSPDGKLTARIDIGDKIMYSVSYENQTIILPSPIAMELAGGTIWGTNAVVRKSKQNTVDQVLIPLYGKRKTIRDHYNELVITFKGNYTLTARVYDEGFAFRFGYLKNGELVVKSENAAFNFAGDYKVWASHPRAGSFEHSYEDFYTVSNLSQMSDSLTMLPVLLQAPSGLNVLITEAALEDYPGFHVVNDETTGHGFNAVFPAYPVKWAPGGHMNFDLKVKERADYIAKTQGPRAFPWRVVMIKIGDEQLLDTDLVYKLSDPHDKNIDFSWVKPGKVAWDWWSAMNLMGVDFRAGINTATYKYYIDFAAENGIEYINLDEGWSDQYDLMKLSDQIDLKEIIEYGKEKGVGVFLWCVHYPLDEKLQEAMDQFEELGVKGLKVDFMDRDDQVMVNYYHRIAKAAAEHKLLVNFHGAYKPAGLHRKYPNVINREGVRGLEYNKFSKPHGTTPDHAVAIPFIRMAAGPMDYTPGAMHNAQKANFAVFMERPMSQGTRCQQLAMYVIYYAPLQMLSDAPTRYEAEPEILELLSGFPTVWDETVPIAGKVGKYAVIARKKGDAWYVAGMTSWEPRELEVNFSFLGEGSYNAEIFKDGINADRNGNDYVKLTKTVDSNTAMKLKLAPGGGFVIKLKAQ